MLLSTEWLCKGALETKGCLPVYKLQIEAIAEPYIKRRAVRHLEKDSNGAGTGNLILPLTAAVCVV
jgi:hypothetical protein